MCGCEYMYVGRCMSICTCMCIFICMLMMCVSVNAYLWHNNYATHKHIHTYVLCTYMHLSLYYRVQHSEQVAWSFQPPRHITATVQRLPVDRHLGGSHHGLPHTLPQDRPNHDWETVPGSTQPRQRCEGPHLNTHSGDTVQ